MTDQSLQERAIQYADLSGFALDLKTPLGKGQDGCVWKSDRKTAVKVFERQTSYDIEIECYQRFKSKKVIRILGFSVPQLRNYDRYLRVIEMGIVAPPYILDFAKSWLDRPADYTPETLADHAERGHELFGEERWNEVQSLVWALRKFGIYYYDTSPGNIRFGDEED